MLVHLPKVIKILNANFWEGLALKLIVLCYFVFSINIYLAFYCFYFVIILSVMF